MGTFTLMLKEVLEYTDDIGLSQYPIFDENYREELNRKIVEHYYTREIGQETVSLFAWQMRVRMQEIMPKYNAIYKAQALDINPLITFKTKTTGINVSSATSEAASEGRTTESSEAESAAKEQSVSANESESDSRSRAMNSAFPQQMLMPDGDYATDGSDSFSKGTGTGKATNENNSESDSKASGSGTSAASTTQKGSTSGTVEDVSEGFSGTTMPELIVNYAEAFINTDLLIIKELESLFFGLWDNGDQYYDRPNSWMGGWYL